MSTENNKKLIWTDNTVNELAEWYRETYGKDLKYWGKEVIEEFKQSREKRSPEYEILSLKYFGDIYTLMDWKKFPCYTQPTYATAGSQISLSWALEHPGVVFIHSVRRLSDGEVFQIGDEVDPLHGEKCRITGFRVLEHWVGGLMVCTDEGPEAGISITLVAKLPTPKPIFTTEDGVEVHSGENCWVVRPQVQGGYKLIRWHEVCESGMQYGERYFSQQKAAQEWIEAQTPKPLFRTEDGVDIYEGDECYICKKSATPNKWNIHKWFKACKEGIDTEGEKYFNSLKAAEEWMAAQKPPVLFTTEDGVDITDHKTPLYMVLAKATWQTGETTTERHLRRAVAGSSAWKYFAIEYNRDRYILLNKPLLSVSDVMDLYQNHSENFETFLSAVSEAAKAKG